MAGKPTVTAKAATTNPTTLQGQLDEMTFNERIGFLDDNAYSVKECEYKAPLTEEEIDEVKTQVTRLSIRMQELEDEKTAFMDIWKMKVKEIDGPLENVIREARTKERIGYGKVWEMVDHTDKMVYKVAEGNLIVGVRKAVPAELAPRLFAS